RAGIRIAALRRARELVGEGRAIHFVDALVVVGELTFEAVVATERLAHLDGLPLEEAPGLRGRNVVERFLVGFELLEAFFLFRFASPRPTAARTTMICAPPDFTFASSAFTASVGEFTVTSGTIPTSARSGAATPMIPTLVP